MGSRARIEELVAQATSKYPDMNARLDALEKAGPPILVALMVLAEDLDVLRQRVDLMAASEGSVVSDDLTLQLNKLSRQLSKMTKSVKKALKRKNKKK
jgi:hypothetical protein